MSRVYWDTMLFVYWLEDHPRYAGRVEQIVLRLKERGDRLCTSTFTVGEALVTPYREQNREGVVRFEEFFGGPSVELLPFTESVARHYAKIRARLTVSKPDAIHLACAAAAGTDVFITNDLSLVGKTVPGIQFIVGLNTDLF